MSQQCQIREALSLLVPAGSVVELRALGAATYYGYYTDFDRCAKDAAVLDSTPGISGIYVTLNQVNPALLSRCANRMKKAGYKEPLTGDGDIIRRIWFAIDLDPVRPSGISSSDPEHAAACEKAAEIMGYLTSCGWPEPIIADSGNGAHLLYRVDLPADADTHALIKACLKALDQQFSDGCVTIDTAVANPARIWKLYGTRARKGDHTPDRPYRTAAIQYVPPSLQVVPLSCLMALAARCDEACRSGEGRAGTGPVSSDHAPEQIDLASWLTTYGLLYTEKPYCGGRLFVLDECPFSSAHRDGAYAIQFANGAIFAGCHHTSCGGGTQRWPELRERFEGPGRQRRRGKHGGERERVHARGDGQLRGAGQGDLPVCPLPADEEIAVQAERMLRADDPIRFFLSAFGRLHEGDEIVAECLIMSLASRLVTNSQGLHVLVTGESGKGKSHAFETMMSLVPEKFCLAGHVSNKALFYQDELRDGMVISIDDHALSPTLQEIVKGVTSSFHKPFVYRTVDKDRRPVMRVIPPRCVWWVAKVEGAGDEQVLNRMLTVWIDESDEQDERVLARALRRAAEPAGSMGSSQEEVLIAREIWKRLSQVSVRIPFAPDIRFSASHNRRNATMLLDLIRSSAALFQFQREQVIGDDGGIEVVATREDFERAQRLYGALNNRWGAQATKLTRLEQQLIEAIRASGQCEFTTKELQALIGRSASTISRIMRGNPQKSDFVGLLEKCPPLSCYVRSQPRADGGYERMRVYTWDFEMDARWDAPISCWLEERDGSGEDGDDGDDPSTVDSRLHVCTELHGNCTEELSDFCGDYGSRSMDMGDFAGGDACVHDGASAPVRCDEGLCDGVSAQAGVRSENDDDFDVFSENGSLDEADSGVQKQCKSVQVVQSGSAASGSAGRVSVQDIDPRQFRKGEWDRLRRCDCCGRAGVVFREKRPEGRVPRPPVMVCERCYRAAVAREVMSVRALVGVLPLSSMIRTDRELGRCSLCHLEPVTWFDEESKVGLCERCYYRERFRARRSGGGEG